MCDCYKNFSPVILNPPSWRKIQQSVLCQSTLTMPAKVATGKIITTQGLLSPVLGVLLLLCAKMEALFFWKLFCELLMKAVDNFVVVVDVVLTAI